MALTPALPPARIAELLAPFLSGSDRVPALVLPASALDQLSEYLDLLMRWNTRVSLTSIRSPEAIVQRHFGESLFAAALLGQAVPPGAELLDFGSGAGFPGLPIQIGLPQIRITLAESQTRKVAFLREVVRTLGVSAEVWPQRVEALPASRSFHVVALRAVDRMPQMLPLAKARVREGGWLLALVGGGAEMSGAEMFQVPGSERRYVRLERVPRGTQP